MVSCPLCKSKTKVLSTRRERRKRHCTKCSHRFETTEALSEKNKTNTVLVEMTEQQHQVFTEFMKQAKRLAIMQSWGVR